MGALGRWRRRLATTLVFVILTELVVFFWSDIVLGLGELAHVYLLGLVAVVLLALATIAPPWLLVGVAWILGLVGFDAWFHGFLSPLQALGYGASLTTLGTAILSPAFFAIRRSYARARRRRRAVEDAER